MSGVARALTVVFVSGTVTLGAYEWYASRVARQRAATLEADATRASADLAACTTARAEAEVALVDAGAQLDTLRADNDELRAARAEDTRRLAAFQALTDRFRKMIDTGKLQVVLRHGRMVVQLPAGILFASGSAELSKDGKAALVEVAAVLRSMRDRRFMVAGHTDNVPIGEPPPRPKPAKGQPALPPEPHYKNNLELSTARALTVAEELVADGMNAAQLVAAGYAEHEPVKPNSTEAGRQENRRIEIVLVPNVSELPPIPIADGGAADAAADAGAP